MPKKKNPPHSVAKLDPSSELQRRLVEDASASIIEKLGNGFLELFHPLFTPVSVKANGPDARSLEQITAPKPRMICSGKAVEENMMEKKDPAGAGMEDGLMAGEYRYEEIPGGMARLSGPDLPAIEVPELYGRQFWGVLEAWAELPEG